MGAEYFLPVAQHAGIEQHAPVGREFAGQQPVDRRQHFAARDVGHETEPALVDADQRHVVRG